MNSKIVQNLEAGLKPDRCTVLLSDSTNATNLPSSADAIKYSYTPHASYVRPGFRVVACLLVPSAVLLCKFIRSTNVHGRSALFIYTSCYIALQADAVFRWSPKRPGSFTTSRPSAHAGELPLHRSIDSNCCRFVKCVCTASLSHPQAGLTVRTTFAYISPMLV